MENTNIYTYTRMNAIEDGVLIDVSKMASEAGLTFPAAVTTTLWQKYIKPSKKLESFGQSIDGRLWDLLMMFRFEVSRSKENTSTLLYSVLFLMKNEKEPELVKLKCCCHLGDDSKPVLTFMLPWED